MERKLKDMQRIMDYKYTNTHTMLRTKQIKRTKNEVQKNKHNQEGRQSLETANCTHF